MFVLPHIFRISAAPAVKLFQHAGGYQRGDAVRIMGNKFGTNGVVPRQTAPSQDAGAVAICSRSTDLNKASFAWLIAML